MIRSRYLKSDINSGRDIIWIGIACLFAGLYQLKKCNDDVLRSDITVVNGAIATKVEVLETGGRNSHAFINLKLDQFTSLNFMIENTAYSASYINRLVHNVKVGDSVEIAVFTDDYQMKITREKPMGFWTEIRDHTCDLPVLEVKDKMQTYLDLEWYNEERRSEHVGNIWFWALIGLALILWGIRSMRKGKALLKEHLYNMSMKNYSAAENEHSA